MRKGALTTGSMVCNSSPVDIRATQFVPGTGLRFGEMGGRPLVPSFCPPRQLKAVLKIGQPNRSFCRMLNWIGLICNCEERRIGSVPMSTKGAMATGPAMVMRYSTLAFRLKSPPGVTSCWYGTGIFQQLPAHAPEEFICTGNRGLAGTNVPSGFLRATFCALGRYAI